MNGILDLSIIIGLAYNWSDAMVRSGKLATGWLMFRANLSGLLSAENIGGAVSAGEPLRFNDKLVEINS